MLILPVYTAPYCRYTSTLTIPPPPSTLHQLTDTQSIHDSFRVYLGLLFLTGGIFVTFFDTASSAAPRIPPFWGYWDRIQDSYYSSPCSLSSVKRGILFGFVRRRLKTMPVIAYRTENGCGWGVKALEKIKERISALLICTVLYSVPGSQHSDSTLSEDAGLLQCALCIGTGWQSDAVTSWLDLNITCTVHIFTNIFPSTSVDCIFVSKIWQVLKKCVFIVLVFQI